MAPLAVLRRLGADRGGWVSVWLVVTLPAIILLVGIGVDLSLLNAHRRYAQGQADLAALSSVLHLRSAPAARAAARATVAANGTFVARPLEDRQIVLGAIDGDRRFVPVADQGDVAGVSAVAVIVDLPAAFPVLRRFVDFGDASVARLAVAEQLPLVSFSLSNCLLSLALYETLLEPVVRGSLHALCSDGGLRLDAVEILDALAADATGLTPGGATYGEVLDADIRYSDLLAAVLGRAVPGGPETVRLGEILHLDEGLRQARVGAPVPPVAVRADDLVFGGLELLRRNAVDLRIEVEAGAGRAGADLQILEPRRIVLAARAGDPEAYAQTSQVRLVLDPIRIGAAFTLALDLRVANAAARLAEARCGREDEDLVALFDPVDASLVDLDVTVAATDLALLPPLRAQRSASLLEAGTRSLAFTQGDVAARRAARFGPGLPGSLPDLVAELRRTTADLLGLIGADARGDMPACSGLLGCRLTGVASRLASAIEALDAAAGRVRTGQAPEAGLADALFEELAALGLAQAQLEVLGVACSSELAI